MVRFKILAFCGAGLARLFEILSVLALFHLIFLRLLARALKILGFLYEFFKISVILCACFSLW